MTRRISLQTPESARKPPLDSDSRSRRSTDYVGRPEWSRKLPIDQTAAARCAYEESERSWSSSESRWAALRRWPAHRWGRNRSRRSPRAWGERSRGEQCSRKSGRRWCWFSWERGSERDRDRWVPPYLLLRSARGSLIWSLRYMMGWAANFIRNWPADCSSALWILDCVWFTLRYSVWSKTGAFPSRRRCWKPNRPPTGSSRKKWRLFSNPSARRRSTQWTGQPRRKYPG